MSAHDPTSKLSASERIALKSKQAPDRQKSRWVNAIREVILDRAQQSLDTEQKGEVKKCDYFGEGITRLINKHPAFSSPQHDECATENNFQPMFSSTNIRRILKAFRELNSATQARLFLTNYGKECYAWTTRDCHHWKMGFRIFCCSLFGATLLFAFLMHVILFWSGQVFLFWGAQSLSILVDVDELRNLIPESVLWIWQGTVEILAWIDATLARGRQVGGREWNQLACSCIPLQTDSQHEPLRRYSPPNEELPGTLSRASMDHNNCVAFCYRMIQNDDIRTQARKNHKSLKKRSRNNSENDPWIKSKPRNRIEVDELLFDDIPVDNVPHSRRASSEKYSLDDLSNHQRHSDKLNDEEFTKIDRASIYTHGVLRSDNESNDFDDATSSTCGGDDASFGVDYQSGSSFISMTSRPSDVDRDLNWVDVGTRIGLRLLNSEHVQRAVASQDTAERIKTMTRNVERTFGKDYRRNPLCEDDAKEMSPKIKCDSNEGSNITNAVLMPLTPQTTPLKAKVSLSRPMHAMWTSASSVARSPCHSVSSMSDIGVESDQAADERRYAVLEGNHSNFTPHSSYTEKKTRKSSLTIRRTPNHTPTVNLNGECKTIALHADHTDDVSSDPLMKFAGSPREQMSVEIVNDFNVKIIIEEPPPLTLMHDEPEGFTDVRDLPSSQRRVTGRRLSPARSTTSMPKFSSSVLPKLTNQRALLQAGVKMVVPMFPMHQGVKVGKASSSFFQMATVVSCRRIHNQSSNVPDRQVSQQYTNCLAVTAILDKCFLRDGKFAEMTLRIMDGCKEQYVPRHSKFPIGACVATTYGVGILVGWRVEDDCHIVRSLWQRRGAGAADAYLNRRALHDVVEATVGFGVQTTLGQGVVLGYVRAGRNFNVGRFIVHIKEPGQHDGHVLEFNRCDILSCKGAEFIPVVELIREASQYQIQMDNYEAAIRHQMHANLSLDESNWKAISKGFDTIWASFLLALEEDREFDRGVNQFFTKVIDFLDRLDGPEAAQVNMIPVLQETDLLVEPVDLDLATSLESDRCNVDRSGPGFWLLKSIFISKSEKQTDETIDGVESTAKVLKADLSESYRKANSIIGALMKTVTIARASGKDQPNLRLGLSIFYEFLLFLRTVVKVHEKNVSPVSLAIWKRTMTEISTTFGPSRERIGRVIKGIAERMERQGNKAKIRILRFVDIVLLDDTFLLGLESGDWDKCIQRVENALVQSKMVEEDSRLHYRMTLKFIIRLLSSTPSRDEKTATRNTERLAQLGKALKWIASPRRSVLKLFQSTYVMVLLERIFVRVFRNEPIASRMITIHASNIHTLRQLRLLKDFTIAGKLWIPMLDAADEEFQWAVTNMPDNFKNLMQPLSKLFSLCVAQFHRIGGGDLTADWLNFLMQEEAVKLIHELDEKLILNLESFCKDVKDVMVVLPYYKSLDGDILNLMDEVDIEELFREASEAFLDPEKLTIFLREKCTLAVERFLDYLPKMSIPVERRDLGDGWVLTCRGEDGGDLTLADVTIKRENLTCKVLGGDSIFFPLFGESEDNGAGDVPMSSESSARRATRVAPPSTEVSILDQIRELLLNAQLYGCWQSGFGGVGQQPTDRYVAAVFQGLPVSTVLNCGIELWRNLEIDDDELLEIAIRDVSYQIRLQKEREEGGLEGGKPCLYRESGGTLPGQVKVHQNILVSESPRRRFNPRVNSTVLFLEMKKLTLNLDMFHFRFEREERMTIFDPVFEGCGSLCVQNVLILLRVECKKGRIMKLGTSVTVPVLQLQEFDIRLENVTLTVKDTGLDWFLNRAVKQFQEKLTEIVEANLKEQVLMNIQSALENLNSHFSINPELLLGLLGITIDDLEEGVIVWV